MKHCEDMSILQYFLVVKKPKADDQSCSSSAKVLLSDPHDSLSNKLPTEAITLANANVTKAVMKSEALQKQKGTY